MAITYAANRNTASNSEGINRNFFLKKTILCMAYAFRGKSHVWMQFIMGYGMGEGKKHKPHEPTELCVIVLKVTIRKYYKNHSMKMNNESLMTERFACKYSCRLTL